MSGYGPPPMPPPPPPPFPPGEWAPPKPTSGKAIASLVCGLVALVGIMCYLPVLAGLVGAILGILGIIETGREGTRSGRGLAIAGTITSGLAMVLFGAFFAFVFTMSQHSSQESAAWDREMLDRQQTIVLERMGLYYAANNNSLGPGGPVLAQERSGRTATPTNVEKVTGILTVDHLASSDELRRGGSGRHHIGGKWEIRVTGPASGNLRFSREGQTLREIEITDIGRGQWQQIYP